MELLIETGIALPVSTRSGANSVRPFIATFTNTIKPVLAKMEIANSSFLYPTANPKRDRRDFLWLLNKYGQQVGKRFTIGEVPTGIRFYLLSVGLAATEHKLTAKYENVLGLKAAISSVLAEPPAEVKPTIVAETDETVVVPPVTETAEVVVPITETEVVTPVTAP